VVGTVLAGTVAGVTDFGYNGVERWIAAGVPVAINIEFGKGELTGAPMPSNDGHVLVIRDFDRKSNPSPTIRPPRPTRARRSASSTTEPSWRKPGWARNHPPPGCRGGGPAVD